MVELQVLKYQLSLVQELELDLYPLAEIQVLLKALELDPALRSLHQWYQNLQEDWNLLVQFALDHQIFIIQTLSLLVQILRPGFSSVDLVFKVLEHKTRIETHSAH